MDESDGKILVKIYPCCNFFVLSLGRLRVLGSRVTLRDFNNFSAIVRRYVPCLKTNTQDWLYR